MKRFRIYELVGDRDNRSISVRDISFTLQANAQSKDQKVIEIDET
jgi:hypothetical protein